MINVMEVTEYLMIIFRESVLINHPSNSTMCPYSQDDELDILLLVDLHIGIRKLINTFFPRNIHTHKMLENEETTTVNVSVLDFKGAVSVE